MTSATFTTICGHTVYCKPLKKKSHFLVDLGANRGEFSWQFSQRFGGTGLLVEANPPLAKYCQTRLPTWTTLNAAVWSQSGSIDFHVSENDEASSVLPLPKSAKHRESDTETFGVKTLPIDQILKDIGRVDVMKVDIEGAEVVSLPDSLDAIVKKVAQLTVEFHCAPEFGYGLKDEVQCIIRKYRNAGFVAMDWSLGELTDVLLVNTTHIANFRRNLVLFRLRERMSKLLNRNRTQ